MSYRFKNEDIEKTAESTIRVATMTCMSFLWESSVAK